MPTYDAAGDIVVDTQGQQYAYDAEGRICAFHGPGGMTGYLYDADGTRTAKGTIQLVSGQLSCDTTRNNFQITRSYNLGPANEQLTELSWSGGTPQWAHTNVWAGGQLVATYSYEYDAYGNESTVSGSTPNEFMYRGEQYDSDLGLYYLRARYYNPATGRLMSRDPNDPLLIDSDGVPTDPASLHKYLYVGGDPINGLDPKRQGGDLRI